VLEPKSQIYMEIPYGTLSRPAISLWEHKRALKYLRSKGAAQVNEAAIFGAVEQLRDIAKTACKDSKAARRQYARQPVESNADLAGKVQDQGSNIGDDLKHYKVEIW
jgi:putative transposase